MADFEIAVVGGGLAGQTAALSLARSGRKVALIAPASPVADRRTTALMDQSIRFLDRLGLWDAVKPQAAPLSVMQIIDGTDRLLRAPPVRFRSGEIGLDAFGWNMPNSALSSVLSKAIDVENNITRFDGLASDIDMGTDEVRIRMPDGETLSASLVVGADGRKSRVRESAGIDARTWSYPQTAVVLNFSHALPHGNVSTEFHTPSGPFTQVPLPGNRSSLVWVVKPKDAEDMSLLLRNEIAPLIENRMQSMLGAVRVEGDVQTWPLSGMTARKFGKGRAVLVGEAGHAFPPIGAQGLNLGFRDIIALETIVGEHPQRPVPSDAAIRFDRSRRLDVKSRTISVDLLNKSLLSELFPVQMLRTAGLHILSGIAPLRAIVMGEGIEPGRGFRELPSLLRK